MNWYTTLHTGVIFASPLEKYSYSMYTGIQVYFFITKFTISIEIVVLFNCPKKQKCLQRHYPKKKFGSCIDATRMFFEWKITKAIYKMYYFINVFFCGHKLFNVSNFCAAAGATVVLAQPMIGPLNQYLFINIEINIPVYLNK